MIDFTQPMGHEFLILFICACGRAGLNAYVIDSLVKPNGHVSRKAVIGTALWCVLCGALVALFIDAYWWMQLVVWSCWYGFTKRYGHESWQRTLLSVLTAWSTNVLSTVLASLTSSYTFMNVTFQEVAAPTAYLPTCLLLVTIQAFGSIAVVWASRRDMSTHQRANLLFGAWLILQGFTVYVYLFYSECLREPDVPLSITSGALSVSYLVLIALYVRHSRRMTRQQVEKTAISEEMAEQQKRFDTLSGELSRIRGVRHDLNNHMTVLASLAQSGRREEALAYLDNLEETLVKVPIRPMTDLAPYTSLVATQAALLQESGITLRCQALSTEEPDDAQALDPLIIWAGHFAHMMLPGKPDASVDISFCEDRRAIECAMRPLTRAELKKGLRADANARVRIPVLAKAVSCEGDTVRLRVSLAMDQQGARDPASIQP